MPLEAIVVASVNENSYAMITLCYKEEAPHNVKVLFPKCLYHVHFGVVSEDRQTA